MQDDINKLRDTVGKGAYVSDGTVVRYVVRDLTYVAIFKGGYWWTTSKYETQLNYEDFMSVLRNAAVIDVAAEWSSL